ncbi:SUN domain-containing protein 5 [Parelaphostrongylus tenuis]|uniref:SUN domain-containing protein 5 n=1 Tax=Parelaphostrongylus tenuis TaxID=148309 RepID=A0AAD5WKJ5_PARTN|nr:SUN domain-containing protein 5 [Parelaphostrongylus tenuis]
MAMGRYEEVRVPTTHLRPTKWERFRWKWEKLTFYVWLIWSRYLWFLTLTNLVGTVVVLFVAGVLSQVMRSDILPKSELIHYESAMDSMQIVESRLKSFEKERLKWELLYNEKVKQMEQTMFKSLSEIRSEIHKLHVVVEQHKSEREGVMQDAADELRSYMASQLEKLEAEVSSRFTDVESQIATTNEQMLKFTNSCLTEPSKSSHLVSTTGAAARGHPVNLASRSHGAFVVPHLTSQAVTSGSLLYSFVDAVIGLQTYNFAITERTHIMPAEAFCFAGYRGNLTIRLWSNTTIEAVEYEHDYWRNHVPISAPKEYEVIACKDHECEESVVLGECTYPSNLIEGPAQICQMKNLSVSTDQVKLVFKRNHGQEYTCIYQLRVLNWT